MTDRKVSKMASYEVNDRIQITYRNFDLVTDKFLGHVTELATVTRIWPNQKTISIRTDSGKPFVRNIASSEIQKV